MYYNLDRGITAPDNINIEVSCVIKVYTILYTIQRHFSPNGVFKLHSVHNLQIKLNLLCSINCFSILRICHRYEHKVTAMTKWVLSVLSYSSRFTHEHFRSHPCAKVLDFFLRVEYFTRDVGNIMHFAFDNEKIQLCEHGNIQCGAILTRAISCKYSQKAPHNSHFREWYGVSFVDPAFNDWYSVWVSVMIYVISYNIGPHYNGTRV